MPNEHYAGDMTALVSDLEGRLKKFTEYLAEIEMGKVPFAELKEVPRVELMILWDRLDILNSRLEHLLGEKEDVLPVAWVSSSKVGGRVRSTIGSPRQEERLVIKPVAFLQSMWAILWRALRHPLHTTVVDLSTGEAVSLPPNRALSLYGRG
jgi:hypothetical protein